MTSSSDLQREIDALQARREELASESAKADAALETAHEGLLQGGAKALEATVAARQRAEAITHTLATLDGRIVAKKDDLKAALAEEDRQRKLAAVEKMKARREEVQQIYRAACEQVATTMGACFMIILQAEREWGELAWEANKLIDNSVSANPIEAADIGDMQVPFAAAYSEFLGQQNLIKALERALSFPHENSPEGASYRASIGTTPTVLPPGVAPMPAMTGARKS